jgi:hypothetical protein
VSLPGPAKLATVLKRRRGIGSSSSTTSFGCVVAAHDVYERIVVERVGSISCRIAVSPRVAQQAFTLRAVPVQG